MSTPILPIACAVNESYVLPLAVMLTSLRHHLRGTVRPVLYLLHMSLSGRALATIGSLIETRSIVPTAAQLAKTPKSSRFPREASFPLLLADVLPSNTERVLFMDADLLVMDDLAKLWESSLEGRVLAGCPDGAVPRCSSPRGVKGWRSLGIPVDASYFNGGVLLIDLAAWRERDVEGRVRRYFASTSQRIDFLHQEALNAAVWDDWQQLEGRWNLLASRAGRTFDPSESEAWRSPGIVHFAGRAKPWRGAVGGPFNEPYQRTMAQVRALVADSPATLREQFVSAYDRHLRAAFHPLEQFLWRRRLL